MLENTNRTGLHSAAVNDILAGAPSWLLKWSIAATCFVFILLLILSFFVRFSDVVKTRGTVLSNSTLVFINPPVSNAVRKKIREADYLYCEVVISQQSRSKIIDGQEMILMFHMYPARQYGTVRGRVDSFRDSLTLKGDVILKIKLNAINTSDVKKAIPIRAGMSLDAEIITGESTILKKILGNYVNSFNH